MKNIQVIDGAKNTAYAIYQISDEGFALLFPEPGQDIEFIEDAYPRGGEKLAKALKDAWKHKLNKKDVVGIHGTLFYGSEYKKKYYPGKMESELIVYKSVSD